MEDKGGKYLTFVLAKEEYGIPILKVREIIKLLEITSIPKTPGYIKGVINLRGKIIPIMDLRLKFGLEEKEYNERTCIVVVEITINETRKLMGLIVDTVSEVANLTTDQIEPPPEYGNQNSQGFLTGVGKVKDRVILLLNIEQILSREETIQLKEMKMEGLL
jgi:purine-binding chemotaxis protein CheW